MRRMTNTVVVIVDGLPVSLAERTLPHLPFLSSRLPYRGTAVSCFPSTTGPAYFPFLAGCTPGRANVPGIRWFDRTVPTRSRFPHRGLRSYVGPDTRKLATDSRARTIFAQHAWPASSPLPNDLPKRGEASRDLVWAFAHFTHRWDHADRRTAWKLGRGLEKEREIVFAVFPSVDELGHVRGIASGEPEAALVEIDRLLEEKLDGFDGEILLSADHGLTDTHTHLDLRAIVEAIAGPTVAFPLIAKPHPAAVVCESGNAMANVYLRGEIGWSDRPSVDRCREAAAALVAIEGIGSVAIRGAEPGGAELWTKDGVGEAGRDGGGLYQRGVAFATEFADATAAEALAASAGERYPDAAFALASLLASDRAGDLLVSAEVGYDLRTVREWPEHRASHGSLDRAHTVVPVLSSAPLRERAMRTLDLFALTLELAGIPLAAYADSDAALLAGNTWQPAVWQ